LNIGGTGTDRFMGQNPDHIVGRIVE
jgi:hypothetical protein